MLKRRIFEEILTFVSTVALGLLAVWQNKRFKEENDESQLRMEKLTKDVTLYKDRLSDYADMTEEDWEKIYKEKN